MRVIAIHAGTLALVVVLWTWLVPGCTGAEPQEEPPSPEKPYVGPAWFDPGGFARKTPPGPGDWLDVHHEAGRSFRSYRRSDPPRAGKIRRVLALQPLGEFTDEDRKLVRTAADFASLYYQLPVRIRPDASVPRKDRRKRHAWGTSEYYWQYRTDWIMRILGARLSADAVALLGVTMEDIYPDPDWNYVFGIASLDERIGVYSLARYRQEFWGKLPTHAGRKVTLLRTLKVLAHETAHMFGLVHCIRYECLVNGSNDLPEADRSPIYLCPDCLRKLAWNRGFDIAARYRALTKFYRKHGLEAQAKFLEGRLARGEEATRSPFDKLRAR